MAIDKLTPRYLNVDDDERLVQSMEMTDALNVRSSIDGENSSGVLKNIKGTTEVTARTAGDAIPATGINTIIGSCTVDVDGVIYYFLHNSVGSHGIYFYSQSTGKYQKIMENAFLNFRVDSHVQADVIINALGEHILYFTDDYNEPRKINATKAISGGYYTNLSSANGDVLAENIDLCKSYPLTPPTYSYTTDNTLQYNDIVGKGFQFATQLIYSDGEVSALSPYSKLTIAPNHFQTTGVPEATTYYSFNSILVTQDIVAGSDVKAVRFCFREGNTGLFRVADQVDVDPSQTQVTLSFSNRGAYLSLPDQEANKLYDAVPLKAKALTISNNRLFLGNYLESFDPVNLDAIFTPTYVDYGATGFNTVSEQSNLVTGANGSVDGNIVSTLANYTGGEQGANDWGSAYQSVDGAVLGNGAPDPQGSRFDLNASSVWAMNGSVLGDLNFEIDFSELSSVDSVFTEGAEFIINLGINPDRIITFPKDPDFVESLGVVTYQTGFGQFGGDEDRPGYIFVGRNQPVDDASPSSQYYPGCSVVYAGYFNLNKSVFIDPGQGFSEAGSYVASQLNTLSGVSSGNAYTVMHGPTFSNLAGTVDYVNNSVAARYSLYGQCQLTFQVVGCTFENNKITGSIRVTNQNFSGEYAISHKGPQWKDKTATGLGGDGNPGLTNADGDLGYFGGIGEVTINKNFSCGPISDSILNDAGLYSANGYARVKTFVADEDTPVNRKTFKSNATHSFGVVFFDRHGRPSTVSPIGDYLAPAVGSEERNGVNGPIDLNISISGDFPSWAKKAQLVYSGNNDIQDTIYVNIAEGATADAQKLIVKDPSFSATDATTGTQLLTPQVIPQAYGIGNANNMLFLSARNFEGKSQSYKDSYSAEISYAFNKGDKLRIISYWDPDGNQYVFPQDHIYEVAEYKYFDGNSPDNPILIAGKTAGSDDEASGNDSESSNYRKSGWFFILDGSPNYTGFSMTEVRDGSSLWGQDVTVEVYRPKKISDEESRIYYEIGEVSDLDSGIYDTPAVFQPLNSNTESMYGGYPLSDSQSAPTFRYFVTDRKFKNGDRVIANAYIVKNASSEGYVDTGDISPVPNANFYTLDTALENTIAFEISDVISLSQVGYVAEDDFQEGGTLEINDVSAFTNSNKLWAVRAKPSTYTEAAVDFYVDSFTQQDRTVRGICNVAPNTVFYGFRADVLENGNPATSSLSFDLTDCGDTYFRSRRFVTNPYGALAGEYQEGGIATFRVAVSAVEDFAYSDFVDQTKARSWDKGRPHIYDPDARATRRHSSMTYSDAYATDGKTLSLSSFNPFLFPFKDYSTGHGGITYIEDRNEALLILQERKASLTPIGRQLIESAADGMLVTSSKVLGQETYYSGEFGPGKDSKAIVANFGRTYFVDKQNGKVVQLGGDGISLISDNKVDSLFEGQLAYLSDLPGAVCVMGVDPEFDEVLVCIPTAQETVVTVDSVDSKGLKVKDYATSLLDLNNLIRVESSESSPLALRNDAQQWEEHVLTWDTAGNGVVFMDHPHIAGYIDSAIDDDSNHRLLFSDTKNSVFTYCTIDGSDKSGSVPDIKDLRDSVSGYSVGYNYKYNLWMSRYSFIPELFGRLHEKLLSFYNGKLYIHNDNASRNTFYGVVYESTATVVSKYNPSMIKVFNAMSLETNDENWSVDLENSYQESEITTAMWDEQDLDGNTHPKGPFREGMLYCEIGGSDKGAALSGNTQNSDMQRVVLGKVTAVNGSGITLDNKINSLPFNIGSSNQIWKSTGGGDFTDTGGTYVAGVTGRYSFKASTPSHGISVGDVLMVQPVNIVVAGDPMRDYYLKLTLTNNSTSAIELYAVNTHYSRSFLHNEKVN